MAGRPKNPTVASLTQQGAPLDYELRHSLPDSETPHQVAGPRGLIVIATGFWARGPPPTLSPKYHHPSQCSTPTKSQQNREMRKCCDITTRWRTTLARNLTLPNDEGKPATCPGIDA